MQIHKTPNLGSSSCLKAAWNIIQGSTIGISPFFGLNRGLFIRYYSYIIIDFIHSFWIFILDPPWPIGLVLVLEHVPPQPCHPEGAGTAQCQQIRPQVVQLTVTTKSSGLRPAALLMGPKSVGGTQALSTRFGPPKFVLLHCCAAFSVAFPHFELCIARAVHS